MLNWLNLRPSRGDGKNSPSSTAKNNRNLMKIVDEILNKPSLSIPTETVRSEIVQFFRESERDGVETSSLKLSLLDPLSRKRIRIPVRSVGCAHFQCFDLHNFLEVSSNNTDENKSAWRCPHCQAEAKLEQLRVDGYFQEVLTKVGPEPQEVELFPDGSWKEVEQIDFKDVFPVGNADDVVEIVPKKKPRAQDDDHFSENVIVLNDKNRSGCQNQPNSSSRGNSDETLDRLRAILGLEKNAQDETIFNAVAELKRKAEEHEKCAGNNSNIHSLLKKPTGKIRFSPVVEGCARTRVFTPDPTNKKQHSILNVPLPQLSQRTLFTPHRPQLVSRLSCVPSSIILPTVSRNLVQSPSAASALRVPSTAANSSAPKPVMVMSLPEGAKLANGTTFKIVKNATTQQQ